MKLVCRYLLNQVSDLLKYFFNMETSISSWELSEESLTNKKFEIVTINSGNKRFTNSENLLIANNMRIEADDLPIQPPLNLLYFCVSLNFHMTRELHLLKADVLCYKIVVIPSWLLFLSDMEATFKLALSLFIIIIFSFRRYFLVPTLSLLPTPNTEFTPVPTPSSGK